MLSLSYGSLSSGLLSYISCELVIHKESVLKTCHIPLKGKLHEFAFEKTALAAAAVAATEVERAGCHASDRGGGLLSISVGAELAAS